MIMNTLPIVPGTARIDGHDWSIERIWPPRSGDPRLPLEARSRGSIRGGYADPGGEVSLVAPGADDALPALSQVARYGRVVAHRPGRRAVVRLNAGQGYAKIVRPGRAQSVREAHERGRGFASGFAVPKLVPHRFPDDQVVCFDALPGRSLGALGADPRLSETDWTAVWEAFEHAWLLAMTAASPTGLPAHDIDDERDVLRTWARHATAQFGGGTQILDMAERVGARLSAAGGASALAHRDLHDGQLLWDPTHGIGLIDLDTCVRADPALDLGNLAAHADFAVAQERWSPARAQTALVSVVRTAVALGIDVERLDAWRGAARFRVACVNALRPRWRHVSRTQLETIHEEDEQDACET